MKLAQDLEGEGCRRLVHGGRKNLRPHQLFSSIGNSVTGAKTYPRIVYPIGINDTEHEVGGVLARTWFSGMTEVERADVTAKGCDIVANEKTTMCIPNLGPVGW